MFRDKKGRKAKPFPSSPIQSRAINVSLPLNSTCNRERLPSISSTICSMVSRQSTNLSISPSLLYSSGVRNKETVVPPMRWADMDKSETSAILLTETGAEAGMTSYPISKPSTITLFIVVKFKRLYLIAATHRNQIHARVMRKRMFRAKKRGTANLSPLPYYETSIDAGEIANGLDNGNDAKYNGKHERHILAKYNPLLAVIEPSGCRLRNGNAHNGRSRGINNLMTLLVIIALKLVICALLRMIYIIEIPLFAILPPELANPDAHVQSSQEYPPRLVEEGKHRLEQIA